MRWGEIVERAERIAIVCTGPSAEVIDRKRFRIDGVHVIAVNDAIRRVGCHTFFTCDPNDKNRMIMSNQIKGVHYVAAVPDDYGRSYAKNENHRRKAEENVTFLRRMTGDGPWSHKPGLSTDTFGVHTGNSAYGALGVAYHMKPSKIAFFGLDGTQEGYAWQLHGNPGDLSHLNEIFATTCQQLEDAQIKVVVANQLSNVKCFKRLHPEEALQWLRA